MIKKALYGLRNSGLRWHEKFYYYLRELGFNTSKSEPDIWMRHNKEHDIYEYVAVYMDDLAIAMKDCDTFISILQDKYKFKLKVTGSITYHLGMDFLRDEDKTLCMAPCKYIEKICGLFERIFRHKSKKNYTLPIKKNDHPELDTSQLLDEEWVQKYQ